MATFRPIQSAFDAGEVSSRLRGRTDADPYKRGLAYAENWEVLPLGPIRKRGPTQLIASLISGGSRLIPFSTAAGDDFVLELGNQELRIYTLAGRETISGGGGGATELVVNGGFGTDTSWTKTNATISGGRAKINITREWDEDIGAYFPVEGSVAQIITISAAGNYTLSWDDGGGAANLIARVQWAGGSAMLSSPGVVALPAANVTVIMEANGDYQEYAYVDNVSLTATGDPASYTVNPPWTTAQLPLVQYAMETGRDRMIFVHPNVAPWFLQRNADGTWTHGNVVFSTAPADCSGTNWPGVIEIFSGRLWLAATPSERNRVWASQVGDILNFSLGTGLDKEALDFKVAVKSAIRWMRGQRNLLLGTDESEHYVTSSGVIAPSDVQVVMGSNFGSAQTQALAVGDQVLYISPDRRRPRAIGFEYQTDGWVSRDLAFLADHITKALIVEAHFVKAPYPAAFFVMADGTARVCAYDRAAQVLAWWRFASPGGRVLSAAVTENSYGTTVWLSVQRENGVYLERFLLDSGPYCLDSYVVAYAAGGVLSGLAHLNGLTVQVVAEGSRYEGVVAGGQAAVPLADGVAAYVGIPFTATARLLALEGGNPAGTSQGMKKRRPKIGVRLNASSLPKVNGRRAAERSTDTELDEATTTDFTGDVTVSTALDGWSSDGVVTLEQDLPFPTEICAVFGTVQQNAVG